jgi:hypothetical protein
VDADVGLYQSASFVGWLDLRNLANLEERYHMQTELNNASIDFAGGD